MRKNNEKNGSKSGKKYFLKIWLYSLLLFEEFKMLVIILWRKILKKKKEKTKLKIIVNDCQ